MGPPPAGRGSLEMERRRAFEAVRALLRGLAARNPVLLLVDDLQYAGQSTVELMHFLGREPPGARLLVLATVRAENDAQIGTARLRAARARLRQRHTDVMGRYAASDAAALATQALEAGEQGPGAGGVRPRAGPARPGQGSHGRPRRRTRGPDPA